MSRNFEEEIRAAEKQLEATVAQMEQVQVAFVATTVDFIKSWYWKQAEATVQRKPEVTKELGVEKLSRLKADVRTLQGDAAKIVDEVLQHERLWWHRKRGDQSYFYYGNRPPDELDKALRLVAGRLAPVLEKYGYLPTTLEDRGAWREWDQSGNYHPPNAKPYYPYGLDWSENMKTLILQYRNLHREAPARALAIEQLKQEKAQSEAGALWEQA